MQRERQSWIYKAATYLRMKGDGGGKRRGGRRRTDGRAKIQFGRLIFALLPNREGDTSWTNDVIGVTTRRDNEASSIAKRLERERERERERESEGDTHTEIERERGREPVAE